MDEHNHQHDHPHDHDHSQEQALPIVEEPLDPANESLAEALRSSFRVLKVIMFFVVILYLFSGVFIVDQTEVAIVSRFGELTGPPREPGLNFAFPFPIDKIEKVDTSLKRMQISDFWLRLNQRERGMELSELSARGSGLDPEREGALLTGDKAIMHLLFNAQYNISDAVQYVRNVADEQELMHKVLNNAALAEAARTTADVVWKDPGALADRIQQRAQDTLEEVSSGITIKLVAAEHAFYPLQTKTEFLAVDNAANYKYDQLQEAMKFREETLNAAAGPTWDKLHEQIQKLDQPEVDREAVIAEINRLLTEEASGRAGGIIELARSTANQIISQTRQETETFSQLLPEYRRNPQLLRARMRQGMLSELYAQPGLTKWLFPPGDKQINLWSNTDPVIIKEAEKEAARKKAGG